MADISKITLPDGNTYDFKDPVARVSIPFGQVDSTSTATAFTATIPGITEYYDGLTVMLKNGVVTSASGFTININNLGAKHAYSNLATETAETTIFNIAYTMLFVYDSMRVEGGGWVCYRGYDSNTNTIGYQLRTNSSNLVAADTGYRYRIWLTSADGKKWVPINTSSSTNSTTARTLNTRPIDPFGEIVYRATNGTCTAGNGIGATGIWAQYTLVIGYSYVKTLTFPAPVYLQCTPQTDGSAVMNDITQVLPTSNDNKIYIFLGIAYSATNMELHTEHPVYYYDGTGVRLWTGTMNASSALTDQEIDDAVEAAYTYNVAYSGDALSSVNIVPGGSKVSAGTVIRITNTSTDYPVDITISSPLGVSTRIAIGNYYEFTMPEADTDVTLTLYQVSMYSISYNETYISNGSIKGLSTDGTRVAGSYADSAEADITLTILTVGSWDPVVTNDTTGSEIACTYVEFDQSQSVWAKVWTCTMPSANVTISAYYND